MARIPRSVIDAYTRELNAVSEENRRGLEDALGRVDWDAPVAVVREQLIAAMQMWCGGATDQAAMLASVFYDGVREISVGEPMGAFAESRREPERTSRAVRAFVQDLVDGKGPEPVRRKCLERLDYEVKRAAAECVDANARRDRKRPRYARVPSGSETCDFCIMLASRGPVYHSEASAGAVDHFHANCDCRVVPMWDTYYVGPSRQATASSPVEGYDPDALYERYVEFMTDGKFRNRMARAADRANGGDGSASGRETSHPMLWAEAKRKGLVTLGSVGDVEAYIKASTSYEDLFERIKLVSGEWEHYGLSEKYRLEVQRTMRATRDKLLGVKGDYPENVILGSGESFGAMPGGEPVCLQTMSFDPSDEDSVDAMRSWCREAVRSEPVEHMLVMMPNGSVWHSVGDEVSVSVGSLDLAHSIVVHNHPETEDGFVSFGSDDFTVMQCFPTMREFWAETEKYEHYAKPNPSIVDLESYTFAYGRGLSLFDDPENQQHNVMEWLNGQGYVDYWRRDVPGYTKPEDGA